jgi:hypothetical protein
MPKLKSAIPPDEVLSRSLSEISAADFIQLLGRDDLVDKDALAILPDKKKFELWIDEGTVFSRPIGDLVKQIKSEKKKVELEKFKYEHFKLSIENVVDPAGQLVDPAADRARLVDEIASAIARKMAG